MRDEDQVYRKIPRPASPMRLSEVKCWETMPDTRERPVVSPIQAIRAKCIDCVGYHPSDVAYCEIHKCPLHPFRFGRNPFSSHTGNAALLAGNEESPDVSEIPPWDRQEEE